MKKLFSLLLALVMVCSLSVTAFAQGETTGTTTLTTEVPDNAPTWTLTVPASATVPYGNTDHYVIGELKLAKTSSNTDELIVKVVATYAPFSDGEGHNIPYKLEKDSLGTRKDWNSGDWFKIGLYGSPSSSALYVNVAQSDWDAVASFPGTYTSVITFTSSRLDSWD